MVVMASFPGFRLHLLLGDRPTVTQPRNNLVTAGVRFVGPGVQVESTLLPALAVEQSHFANSLLRGGAEQLIAFDGNVGFPLTKGAGLFTIGAVPFGALGGLQGSGR